MSFIEFVRVKDKDTGHEYDVPQAAVDQDAHEVLEDYPPNETGIPRPPKHRVDKDGQPPEDADPEDPDPAEPAPKKATAPAATTKKEK